MYTLRADEFFADPGFPLAIASRDPQPLFPIHTHDFSELVLVIGGTGVHFTEEGQYQVIPGDAYIINGDLAHGYKNLDDLVLINIIFQGAGLGIPDRDLSSIPGYHLLFTIEPAYRYRDRFQSRLRLSPQELDRARNLTEAIERELSDQNPGYQFMARSYFLQLIGFLSRAFGDGDGSGIARQRYRLGKVISYMEHHRDRMIRIEELTGISGSSESTLLRDFKRITGSSPLEYHLRIRISRACELLRSSSFSITQVAFETGFEDSNYFSRQFKRIMDVPPREYRRHHFGTPIAPHSPGRSR